MVPSAVKRSPDLALYSVLIEPATPERKRSHHCADRKEAQPSGHKKLWPRNRGHIVASPQF
jgi:hypothetical protein